MPTKQPKKSYLRTTFSCFAGIFVQAIITNLMPILFIPLMKIYGFTYAHLGILVAINFCSQVATDLIFSALIDKLNYKSIVLGANLGAFFGLALFSATPYLFSDIFTGLTIATIIFSMSSGILEVVLSPITDGIPSDHKGGAMSLMHSFYAWGQAVFIILTTLFIHLFGGQNWNKIAMFWLIMPAIDFFMFLNARFPDRIDTASRQTMGQLITKPYYIVALLAIFFGAATEVTMNQWASVFSEKALMLPKLGGDLLGMCGFAVMLGLGRLLHGTALKKANIHNLLIWGSVVCVACYLIVGASTYAPVALLAIGLCGLASSLLWPGTLVVSAQKYPLAGGWMFAILAAAGDIGAAVSPMITGFVADHARDSSAFAWLWQALGTPAEQGGLRLAIALGAIFPVCTFFTHIYLKRKAGSKN